MKRLKQYSRRLTLQQISDGMNHCRKNAQRLLQAAKTMHGVGDFATAVSLAVLAIEESGKVTILRRMVTAVSENEMRRCWKEFRSHCSKTSLAKIFSYVGATVRLADFRPAVGKTEENEKLDDIKQFSFYVDCVDEADWVIPSRLITEELSVKMMLIARIACDSGKETTVRELELWKETVGSCFGKTFEEMQKRLILWRQRLEEEGLEKPDPGFAKFIKGGLKASDIAGHNIPEHKLAVIRSELSIDNVWRTVLCGEK